MHSILFETPSFTLYTYGFFVAVAMLVSLAFAGFLASRKGVSANVVMDLLFIFFVAGILGARLFYVLQHPQEYAGRPWLALSLPQGGLVWYGGFAGGLLGGLVYARFKRLPILKYADFFAPVLPLAHGIGRLGCFFNGCCYGRIVDASVGVRFEGDSFYRLPSQLYEAALLFALSAVLVRLSWKKLKDGELFLYYLIFYSSARFMLEFLRGDQRLLFFLTIPQWTSLLLFSGSFALLLAIRRRTN